MALIICPECQREISDKARTCPHCGCPIDHTTLSELPIILDQTLDTHSTPRTLKTVKKKSHPKRFILLIVSLIAIIIVGIICYSQFQKVQKEKAEAAALHDAYIDDLIKTRGKMITSFNDSKEVIDLVKTVWSTVVVEHGDISISISRIYKNIQMKRIIASIKESQLSIEDTILQFQDPSDEFLDSSITILEMYQQYKIITDLAITPEGTLLEYADKVNTAIDNFEILSSRLKTQIPEKINDKDSGNIDPSPRDPLFTETHTQFYSEKNTPITEIAELIQLVFSDWDFCSIESHHEKIIVNIAIEKFTKVQLFNR